MLPLHVWNCTAISRHLVCAAWWAGGAFSLASSTAGKEHRSVEGDDDAVLERTREAGPGRTLALRHPTLRHVAAAYAVSPSPPVTALQKAAALPHAFKQMKPERSVKSRLVLLGLI